MSKGRLPPFVPLLIATLDSPAWRAMSHGAKILYVALKRRVPHGRNRAYLSYRQAENEVVGKRTQISVWFLELQHYGFIVLVCPGSLGVDSKGKAPHWRLTELGTIPKATADGLPELPTRDFLKWDGTKFRAPCRCSKPPIWERRKIESRPVDGTHCPVVGDTPVPWTGHPKAKVSRGVGHREDADCPVVEDITSLTTTAAPSPPGDGGSSLTVEPKKLAIPEVSPDCIEALLRTEAKRKGGK
jgi:hypothetical protein